MKQGLFAKILLLFLFAVVCIAGTSDAASLDQPVDYGRVENWAYLEQDNLHKAADVFFVCPTVFRGDNDHFNMELEEESTRQKFVGATNMEKGIYDQDARFFAPYYRMAAMSTRQLSPEDREKYIEVAYKDVRRSFLYYLEHLNQGRPFLLAGFSQGSDHILRLLKEFGEKKEVRERLVAAYCPGWFLTPEDLLRYPYLKPAKGEDDTGVIVSYNTEAIDVTSSTIVPANVKTISINPLSWRTDSVVADKSLNRGACFTDYSGNIKREIPDFTGAYIDPDRGTLKVTDVNAEDYPPKLPQFGPGVYHIYDYQFFYRNLQENVAVRIARFTMKS